IRLNAALLLRSRSDATPTGARCEAVTVLPRERFEPSDDFRYAALDGVPNRTAGERREPGAENDSGIEQIRILDDAFVPARDGLVHEREHQAILQVRIGAGEIAPPLRLAVDVAIKVRVGFHAELYRGDLRFQRRRDGAPLRLGEDSRDVQGHVG